MFRFLDFLQTKLYLTVTKQWHWNTLFFFKWYKLQHTHPTILSYKLCCLDKYYTVDQKSGKHYKNTKWLSHMLHFTNLKEKCPQKQPIESSISNVFFTICIPNYPFFISHHPASKIWNSKIKRKWPHYHSSYSMENAILTT